MYISYAHECHLTGNIEEAITYQAQALELCKNNADLLKRADCLAFLSRLYTCQGHHKKASSYGRQAVAILENQSPSRAMVLAFSNMSRLTLNSNKPSESLDWAERAIGVANSLEDKEALCQAMNVMGNIKASSEETKREGIGLLQQSLALALTNQYPDLACNTYLDLAVAAVGMKMFTLAKGIIPQGISHCSKRGLYRLANDLLAIQSKLCLEAARAKARESRDLKHTLPLALAFLEYEWLSGTLHLKAEDMGAFASMLVDRAHPDGHEWQEFRFWVQKARHQSPSGPQPHLAYRMTDQASAQVAASFWQQCECPYMRALMLFEGNEKDKRSAIEIMDKLGAQAVADKFKREMRAAGIKRIPRGIRKTTSSNKAHLTQREMEVLHLLQEGMQNKEIAEKLFVSPKTVDHHVSAILLKLDVNSRAKAVQEALRRNILSIESLFIS